MKEKKTILVTWDFTPVSENAFLHALKIAKTVDNNVRLLHISKPDDPMKIREADDLLKKDAIRLSEEHNVTVESVVVQGTIFNAISKYSSDNNEITMVVMGTHGIKGKQKYFGSYALRVIIGSPVPFIVVQDKPLSLDRFSDIVFPIDFKSENKEKLQWAIFLGKYFNSKVHLFKSPVTDKSLAKKVNTNLNFAIRFLIQNNLDYEIHTARKSNNFSKEMMAFAKEINADMILITTTKHITFLDYLFGAPEQYIMANASRIPIMVVNPKASFAKMGQFMYGNT
ncbi:MAG TPA: universal stress protein [Bacteroidales bacterium]|nr:universal stress protein [Bacteroidales bacterium]